MTGFRPLDQRFWSKVKAASTEACWPWRGCKNSSGYGLIEVNGKQCRAHRISWRIHLKSLPAGMCVLHRCDNPLCVNPRHLFLGTRRDNNIDKVNKGRARGGRMSGVSNPASKLTEPEVRSIRKMAASDTSRGSQARIARRFGVSETMVSYIVRRKKWSHLE